MNPLDVADCFRAYAAAQEVFAGWDLRLGQSSDEIASSTVIFDARDEPLVGSANISTVHLAIIVETHSQDATGADHAARVTAMRQAFFGATPSAERATRTTVAAAINEVQANIQIYGYGAGPNDPGLDQLRFRTPINVIVGAGSV